MQTVGPDAESAFYSELTLHNAARVFRPSVDEHGRPRPRRCIIVLLLFLIFNGFVANPKTILHDANPARGLLNREKRTK